MANIQLYLVLFIALNSFLFVTSNYIGKPEKKLTIRATLKKPLVLSCAYTGTDGDGQFVGWYKDDEPIAAGQPNYVVKQTEKELTLSITLNETDKQVRTWSARTNKSNNERPPECQFSRITILPTPERIETNLETEKIKVDGGSVRRLQDEPLTFKCITVPARTKQRSNKSSLWMFSQDNKKFSDKLPIGVDINDKNEILIEKVKKFHRGYYRCRSGNVPFTVLLRVKDQLAALWPFLSIVSTVIVLVIGILIFEKRQKAAKKAAAAEDGSIDNAKNPLVEPTTKLSSNESQRAPVNA